MRMPKMILLASCPKNAFLFKLKLSFIRMTGRAKLNKNGTVRPREKFPPSKYIIM
jgi:hypothetical protein